MLIPLFEELGAEPSAVLNAQKPAKRLDNKVSKIEKKISTVDQRIERVERKKDAKIGSY